MGCLKFLFCFKGLRRVRIFNLFFIAAALIAGPRLMQNVADGNTFKWFTAFCFVQAETVFINSTKIFSVGQCTQMFARIPFHDSAASAAARAFRFPLLFLRGEVLLITKVINHGLFSKIDCGGYFISAKDIWPCGVFARIFIANKVWNLTDLPVGKIF